MADVSKLSRLIAGVLSNVDLSTNALVVQSVKIGASGLEIKETTGAFDLNNHSIANVNTVDGRDVSVDGAALDSHISDTSNPHSTTKAQVGLGNVTNDAQLKASQLDTDGTLAADSDTNVPSQKAVKTYVDSASSSVSAALDGTFRIKNTATPTKEIAFDASGISSSTTRTLKMANADVDLSALTNSNIASGAAIAYSKLNLANSIVNADIASGAAIAYSKLSISGSIVNSDIASAAAISYSKLALSNSIVNADVASGAAIAYSKLALSNSIVNADISSSAAIVYSKLSIADGDLTIAKTSGLQTALDSKWNKDGSNGPATSDWDMGAHKITTTYVPVNAADLVNKAALDQAVITGGTVKEALLVDEQLVDGASGGIRAAMVFHFTHGIAFGAADGDTLSITDGTNTETYTFRNSPSLTFDVLIGAGESDTEANLVSNINANSAYWAAKMVLSGLNFPDLSVVVIMDKVPTSPSTSRIYGTFGTPSNVHCESFNGLTQYTTSSVLAPTTAVPSSDPGSVRFGFGRVHSALVDGEEHVCLELNEIHSWNASSDAWFMLSGGGSVPNATSGSGGGTLGKVTADSDKGLTIGSGILSTKIDNSTVNWDGSGNLRVKPLGITNGEVSSSAAIAYSKLSLSNSIVNADVASGAAIVESKLSLDYSTSSLNTLIGTNSGIGVYGGDITTYTNNGTRGLRTKNSLLSPLTIAGLFDYTSVTGDWANYLNGGTLITDVLSIKHPMAGGQIELKTSNNASGDSGNLGIMTGESSTGYSGGINIWTGTGQLGSGILALGTADAVASSGAGSGDLTLYTGAPDGAGTRGQLSITARQVNVNSTKIVNVTDPTSAQDAATKSYVDSNGFVPDNVTLQKVGGTASVKNGGISNAQVSASAAIAYSKLSLSNSIALGDMTADSVDENKVKSSSFDSTMTGGSGSKIGVDHAPQGRKTMVAGESFAANRAFLVRMAMNGETAGRVYKADNDASGAYHFHVIGMTVPGGAVSPGGSVDVVMLGSADLGSSDTPFNSTDIGLELFLGSSGAIVLGSALTNGTGEAAFCVGVVETTTRAFINSMQLRGIA